MNHVKTLMMIFGFALISACASNQSMDTAEADTAAAPAVAEAQPAAMEEAKPAASAEAVAEEAPAPVAAEPAAEASGNLVSTCTHGDATRVITIVYDNPETGTACEVSYKKDSGTQVLWSANNDRDYCLGKAQAFVEKQQGWGWDCSELK